MSDRDPSAGSTFERTAGEGARSGAARAAFAWSRLVALAEHALQAVADDLSPDLYAQNIRHAIRHTQGLLEDLHLQRLLLGLTLQPPPPAPPLGAHAANVCLYALCMGRLLGLDRGQLSDLGFAALFHDLGRAGRGRQPNAEGTGEDPDSAWEHLTNGVAFALRGRRYGEPELLRLCVAQEHHRTADGYPPETRVLRRSHPFTLLVAVADAFDRRQHGTPWAAPECPSRVLADLLGSKERYDHGAASLLGAVLGHYPRGTFLGLDRSTVVVLDGGRGWGDAVPVRRVLLADGTPDRSGQVTLEPPLRFDAAAAQVRFQPWAALIGADPPSPSPASPGPARPGAAEPLARPLGSAAEVQQARQIVEALQKGVQCFRLYPAEHPNCARAAEAVMVPLSRLLKRSEDLILRISREGIGVGEALLTEEAGRPSDLSTILFPAGVQTLGFTRGIELEEVGQLLTILSRQADEATGQDLLDALWRGALPHVTTVARDPLTPGTTQVLDPILAPVAARLEELFRSCLPGVARLEADLASLRGSAPAGLGEAPLVGPLAQAAESLLAQLRDPFLGDTLGRAASLVAWMAGQDVGAADAEDLSAFVVGCVSVALWRGDLGRACELLAEAIEYLDMEDVSAALVATPQLSLLFRLLRADPGLRGKGLRFLSCLSEQVTPEICQVYGTLTGEPELRAVLRAFLVTRLDACAGALVELARHPDAEIAAEAVKMLAESSPGSPAFQQLRGLLDDADPGRARAAKEAVDGLAVDRRTSLRTLRSGVSKGQRVEAARRLRELGDPEAYEQVRALVLTREFSRRDEDEIEQVLETLAKLGGLRAVSVLQELAQRRSGLLGRGTLHMHRAATWVLRTMRRGEVVESKAAPGVCPRCRFQNTAAATVCLSCTGPLVPGGEQGVLTRPVGRPRRRPPELQAPQELLGRVAPAAEPPPPPPPPPPPAAAKPPDDDDDDGDFQIPPPQATYLPEPDAPPATLWLTWPPTGRFPLGTKASVTLGRRDSCDLILPHSGVSRVHAVIRQVGGESLFEDCSSNGTLLNGQQATKAQLKPGDVLTVGPYELTVHGETEDEDEQTEKADGWLSGRLGDGSLGGVLHQLESLAMSGALELSSGDKRGVLIVREGRPVCAEMGELRDTAAVIHMIHLTKGSFSFKAGSMPGEQRMHLSLTGLLLEASKRLNESDLLDPYTG